MGHSTQALLILLSVLASACGATAQSGPRPTVAAPIVLPRTDPPPVDATGVRLIDRTATVQCDGAPINPVYSEALPPRILDPQSGRISPVRIADRSVEAGEAPNEMPDEVVEFAIGADGRAHGIRPAAAAPPAPRPSSGDIEASLAAWRFPPAMRSNCRLTVAPRSESLGAAPPMLVARALVLSGRTSPLAAHLRQALKRPGDDCDRRPGPLIAAAPDRRKLAPEPGGRGWVVVRASIEADGRAVVTDILDASTPGAAEEGRRAVSDTVFPTGSPATGCIIAFSRYSEPPLSPPPPPPDVTADNQCGLGDAARLPALAPVYPSALLERGIEGWAVVRYDIASWGSVGGVEVLASEPASAFGDSARQAFQTARATPAFEHAHGCVQRVIFRLPSQSRAEDED